MRVLVLGGGVFVGRAVVEQARRSSLAVTTFHWDPPDAASPGVEHVHGDRRRPDDLSPLVGRTWDLVVDTWRGEAAVVGESARLLAPWCGRYAYVSSLVVHEPGAPGPLTERHPVRAATPGHAHEPYADRKAAAEREVLAACGDRALLARPGLILGPHEYAGRLPWWLTRMGEGGTVLAPGDPARPVQFVDVRDLAGWLLHSAAAGLGGAWSLTCPPGDVTMGGLLTACARAAGAAASLSWVGDDELRAAGVRPWVDIPLWILRGEESVDVYDVDVSRALASAARFRPVHETVRDVWRWWSRLTPGARAHAVEQRGWITRAREADLLREHRR